MKSLIRSTQRKGLGASLGTGILALALAFALGVTQPTTAEAGGPSADHRASAFINAETDRQVGF